jgi:hypothetical protein
MISSNQTVKLSGHFKLQLRKSNGSLKNEMEFDNLITNIGLNRIATGSAINGCAIGSGTSIPAVTDTQLQTFGQYTTNIISSTNNMQLVNLPNYGFSRKTYRFAEGSLNGNYSEIGVGWLNNQLFSRALIKDANGNPTTITVLPDEFLDVTYEVRLYIPTTDVVTTGELTGLSNNITITRRPIFVTQVGSNTGNKGWTPLDGTNTLGGSAGLLLSASAFYPTSYTQILPMTTPSTSVSSISGGPVTLTTAAYVNNSLQRSFTMNFSTSTYVGTYQHFVIELGMCGCYQFFFDTPIVKTSDQILTMYFTSSWGRY